MMDRKADFWRKELAARRTTIQEEFERARDRAKAAFDAARDLAQTLPIEDMGASAKPLPIDDREAAGARSSAGVVDGADGAVVVAQDEGGQMLAALHNRTVEETLANWDEEGWGVLGVGSGSWTCSPRVMRTFMERESKAGGVCPTAEAIKKRTEWFIAEEEEEEAQKAIEDGASAPDRQSAAAGPIPKVDELPVFLPCREEHPGWCRSFRRPALAKSLWEYLHALEPAKPRRKQKGESRYDDAFDQMQIRKWVVIHFHLPGKPRRRCQHCGFCACNADGRRSGCGWH